VNASGLGDLLCILACLFVVWLLRRLHAADRGLTPAQWARIAAEATEDLNPRFATRRDRSRRHGHQRARHAGHRYCPTSR
jgi:hypothetical protein